MATLNDLMQEMVNKDYDELVAFGKLALKDLMPWFVKMDEDNKGFMAMTSVVLSAIGADGTLTTLERSFLRDVLGLNDDQISSYIKMYDSKMADLTDYMHDNLPTEFKAPLMTFILAILSVDEKISREETAFVHKLFN